MMIKYKYQDTFQTLYITLHGILQIKIFNLERTNIMGNSEGG